MAEGWKQAWEDLLNSLRGTPAEEEKTTPFVDAPSQQSKENSAPSSTIQEKDLNPPLAAFIEEGQEPDVVVSSISDIAIPEEVFEETAEKPKSADAQPWIFFALAALAGLWMVFGNRLIPQWNTLKAPAPDVIASFDGGQITLEDVEAHLALLLPDEAEEIVQAPELIALVIEDLAMDELVRIWAEQRQPDTDESFQHTMQHITEDLNLQSLDIQLHEDDIQVSESEIQAYFNENREQFGEQTLASAREQIRQLLVAEREQDYILDYIEQLKETASITRNFELLSVPEPDEDDLLRYYEENRDQFAQSRQFVIDELRISIVEDEVRARQTADDALLMIRSGATFDDVVQDNSSVLLSSSIAVLEGQREPLWDENVDELTEGELSNVFQVGDAFYIIRLISVQSARTLSLNEVRPQVLAVVEVQVEEDWFENNAAKTLFTLRGERYTVGQFYQEYRELSPLVQAEYAGSEGLQRLAEGLIERLLIVTDTYDQLLDVQNQPLADEARLQLLRQMLHQEEVDDKIEIGDEELQLYYETNLELMSLPSQARIRYIRIGLGASEEEERSARDRATEAYKKLVPGLFQDGEDFSKIALEYSEDPDTAANGGEFPGWVGESEDILAEIQLHPFHEAILPLQPDEISAPFQFGDSLYIVQIIERTEPEVLPFEEARPYIEDILFQEKHEELLFEMETMLLEEANFVLYAEVIEQYLAQLIEGEAVPGLTP